MHRRILGRTGLAVSEIGLGTWGLGGLGAHAQAKNYGPVPESDAREALQAYLRLDGNFVDTAYNYHDSERRIGNFLRETGARDRVVLSSKVWAWDEPSIRRALDESRTLLGTDVIDLYYLHNPPDEPDQRDRVLDLFDRLKAEGKIRFTGATIKGHNVTSQTVDLMHQYIATGRCDVIMCIYSVLRQKTAEAFAHAAGEGVGIVVRTVLESGFLTGRYAPGHTFHSPAYHDQDHRRRWAQEKLDRVLALAEEFGGAARQAGCTPSEAAIRFALGTPHVGCVLLGCRDARQVESNLAPAFQPALPRETWQDWSTRFGGHETTVSIDL